METSALLKDNDTGEYNPVELPVPVVDADSVDGLLLSTAGLLAALRDEGNWVDGGWVFIDRDEDDKPESTPLEVRRLAESAVEGAV